VRTAVLAIFATAVAMRLVHFAMSAANPLLYSPVLDEAYYIRLGKSIAAGYLRGENWLFFMDPLYGYLLGGVFYVFGDNLTTVRIAQILLDSLNTALIYAVGVRVWNARAGLAAAGIYSIYKVAFFYTLLILKTTLSATFSLLFVLGLIKTAEKEKTGAWIALGAMAGLMTYLRANLLLMAPLAILFYYVIQRPPAGKLFKQAALFLIALMAVLSIGMARNYMVSGELVLLNTQTGRLLYASNNPENLTGRYNVPSFSRPNPEDSETDFHREAERRTGRKMTVKEVSRYWTGETLKFLLHDPSSFAALIFNKLKGTIGDYEIPNNHSFYLSAMFSPVTRFPLPTFAFALALGLPGLAIGIMRRKEALWLLVPMLTIFATVMIFYTSSRFRMPAVPFLLIGAGISVDVILRGFRRAEPIKTAVWISLAAVVLSALSLSVPKPEGTGNEEFFLAKAYWRQNDLNMARAVAMTGAKNYPAQPRFRTLLGMTALSAEKYAEAEKWFKEAISVNPRDADAWHNLGLAYLAAKAPEKASQALEKAIALDSRPESLFAMGRAREAMGDRALAAVNYRRCLDALKPGDRLRPLVMKKLQELGG